MDSESRIGGWLIKLAQTYAERLPVSDRSELAQVLLYEPEKEIATASGPDWQRARTQLWTL